MWAWMNITPQMTIPSFTQRLKQIPAGETGEFSVLKLVDIATGSQRTLTHRSRYFSPVLHPGGDELLAVQVNSRGESRLDRISVSTGQVIASIPNPGKLFFTQSAYINNNLVVSAVRSPNGNMALVTIDLSTGVTDELVPFSFTVLGYPVVHGDSIYFNAQDAHTDQVFSVSLKTGQICGGDIIPSTSLLSRVGTRQSYSFLLCIYRFRLPPGKNGSVGEPFSANRSERLGTNGGRLAAMATVDR